MLRLLGQKSEPEDVQSILCGGVDTRADRDVDRDAKTAAGRRTGELALRHEFIVVVEKILLDKNSDERRRQRI